MNAYALLPLASFFANVFLSAAVFTRSPRALPNRLFTLVAMGIAYWSLLKFTWRLIGDPETGRLLYQLSAPGWCFLPSLYLHFVIALYGTDEAQRRARPFLWAVHAVSAGFAISAAFPGVLVERMHLESWGLVHVPGPAYRAFSAYFITVFAVSITLLLRERARGRDPSRRRQALLLAIGIFVPVIGGFVTNMVMPLLGHPVMELGEILSTVNAAFVGWAMIRHDLLARALEQAPDAIITTMGDALLVAGPSGDVVLANPAAERLLATRTLLGRPLKKLVRAEHLFAVLEGRASGPQQGEGELIAEGGERIPVVLSLKAVRIGRDLGGIVCVAQDVRPLRRAIDELEEANSRLAEQAITDELTGAVNRREARDVLHRELERGLRYQRSFSVGLLDLDGFKQVNDQRGHAVGDDLLRKVTAALRATLRRGDVVARWGGDEFLILFLEQEGDQAARVAERLLAAIESIPVGAGRDDAPPSHVHASLGLSTFDPAAPISDIDKLIREADDALYAAKRAGKGRVVRAKPGAAA